MNRFKIIRSLLVLVAALVMGPVVLIGDVLIRTTDGRTIRVRVARSEVRSIEFTDESSGATGSTTGAGAQPTNGSTSATTPSGPAAARWVSSTTAGHFYEKSGTGWVESANGRVTFRFVEQSATAQYVQLFDRTRGVTVRLYADHVTWSKDLRTWSSAERGGWR